MNPVCDNWRSDLDEAAMEVCRRFRAWQVTPALMPDCDLLAALEDLCVILDVAELPDEV